MTGRQRLIFCPKGEAGQGLLTVMQGPILRRMKKVMYGFCHSVSCTEMSLFICATLDVMFPGALDIVCLCFDGSNHDGH